MSQRFAGKVVLVSGGTGGLGRAVTLAFLKEGADVVVTYQKQSELDALKDAAQEHSSRLDGHKVDVTDEVAVSALVDDTLQKHGKLDALANTVGGYAGGLKLWEMDAKVFDQMLQLNLRSGFALSRAVVPAMLKQGHGSYRECRCESGYRSRCRSIGLCVIESSRCGAHGLSGR
ncbi:SDR family NAD(P)-dependent oxidoreductase [Acidobacterium sp. S8]|uniref:SDR family NAD(P)-dependent oxidoreductase n=1 Tax=Acidobacterium sp. S8 TaxID=1641854 RepID=UPI0020B1207F|nr:SDR family NAD(P)-dependent oxidoreductase [Acidobacterium sp. S8]